VQGAAHVRRDEPNQDAIETRQGAAGGPPLIVAVSDGHGSPKSFRSGCGARFAVKAAIDECQRQLCDSTTNLTAIRRVAERQLPAAVVGEWERLVRQDMVDRPFTPRERRQFVGQFGAEAWRSLLLEPLIAYGATLLFAFAARQYLVLGQLGDGDVVTVTQEGCATRAFSADPRHFAGETASLCLKDAVKSFSVSFRVFKQEIPALILLSTDGYSNSYQVDADFLSVGPDLLSMLREESVETVQRDLASWLEEVSSGGSGDDITLGALCML
jgi:serine/threonine protein phosphatase PrpC